MMLKIMGAVIITFTCGASGYALSQQSRFRLNDMEEMKKAVLFYKGCVNAMGLMASESFGETSKKVSGAVQKMFLSAWEQSEKKTADTVSEIWKKAVDENFSISFFGEEDREILYSFGAVPGFMDIKEQNETADMIISAIENICCEIREKTAKEEKLFRSCSILCGMLISILLF